MLFKSQIITEASGSLGGTTFLQTRGGLAARARTIPINPATSRQSEVRNLFTELSVRWNTNLSVAQRTNWNAYAIANPVTGKFGDPVILSGQNMYIRLNGIRTNGVLPAATIVDDPPVIMGLTQLTTPFVQPQIGTMDVEIQFTNTDPWANVDEGHLFVLISRQRSAGNSTNSGPYQLLTRIDGDSSTPPVSPVTVANPFSETYGDEQTIAWTATASMDTGQPSAKLRDIDRVT